VVWRKESGRSDSNDVFFYDPSNDCNRFPDGKYSPLFYFDTSQNCVIPGDDKNPTINSIPKPLTKCPEMMTLSFHVESVDEIRCYLYLHGGVIRFIPEDIQLILPRFFDMEFGNNAQWVEDMKDKKWFNPIRDEKFGAFLSLYQSEECTFPNDGPSEIKSKWQGMKLQIGMSDFLITPKENIRRRRFCIAVDMTGDESDKKDKKEDGVESDKKNEED